MLVALPSSIAFGVLTYTALGEQYAGLGAMAGMLGAAALGVVSPLVGRTAGLVSAPCAPSAAVLSALIVSLMTGATGHEFSPESILPLMALTAFLAALLQILYGVMGGGRLIKFIPYPVVSGYLSGVGVLIALGQIPKLLGLPKDTPLLHGLLTPSIWKWQGLVVGLVTIVMMALAGKITDKLPLAIIGLFGGLAAYFALAFFFPTLLTTQNNPLVIGLIHTSGSFWGGMVERGRSLLSLRLEDLRLVLVPALTLSVLLSIDTLKTCVGLDNLTRSRHNSDRTLIGLGAGNLASFCVGGMPGAGTMGPTLVNITSGGKTYRSGLLDGIFVILVVLLMSPLIAWVPIGALAGILLVIAWRMFDFSMFRLLTYPAGRLDFAVIAGVITVALTVDLIAASGMGVALSILLFIRDQIHGSVIRRKLYLSQITSKTRRSADQREVLKKHGEQGIFCELQDNLFFGTTDQLFSHLEADLKGQRYLLFDLRRVRSIDYTAAHLFEQMQHQLAEQGGQLLFCGLPTHLNFENYLSKLGLVQAEGGGILIFETLDGALEWIEEQILAAAHMHHPEEMPPLELAEFDLFRRLDDEALESLQSCLEERVLAADTRIFSQGDHGDELFLVRRGSVRILLPLEGGKFHHLATIGRGGFFGELSFLDGRARSADVECKEATDLYILSRSRFDEQARSNTFLGNKIFARIASAIAERLREADAELQALEER